jgi:hypothetical protein
VHDAAIAWRFIQTGFALMGERPLASAYGASIVGRSLMPPTVGPVWLFVDATVCFLCLVVPLAFVLGWQHASDQGSLL